MNLKDLNVYSNRLTPKSLSSEIVEENLYDVVLQVGKNLQQKCDLNMIPQLPFEDRPFIYVHYTLPAIGVMGLWRPDAGFNKNLIADWTEAKHTNLSYSAPIVSLYDNACSNIFTITLSEVKKDVSIIAGVHEETGEFSLDILLYLDETTDVYTLKMHMDFRKLLFSDTIYQASSWWDMILPDSPVRVPEIATLPMYSTWYSYHQNMTEPGLLKECRIAAKLGMKTIIIDDGWQTSDNNRGYAYCGDWNPTPDKFPDFSDFIEEIHKLGMKCILWYSVPFVGRKASVWSRFENKLIHFDPVIQAGTLDPRYREVREYLINTYIKGLKEWDLDGFKLDFIDTFRTYEDTPAYESSMDYVEIQDAVYKLLLDVSTALQAIKPDLMIEFRQNYIGPETRRFGNLFRVGDCPLSQLTNKIGIVDLKLMSGTTAVPSDMFMWHLQERPEDIAIQLIHCIFSTLQISVRLEEQNEEQLAVLKNYLDFAVSNREVLQMGTLKNLDPSASYPVISSCSKDACVTACYQKNQVLSVQEGKQYKNQTFLNATHDSQMFFQISEEASVAVEILDCFGKTIAEAKKDLAVGIYTDEVPCGGMIRFIF